MVVFSNIIPQKRVLDAGHLFSASHVWNDPPSFHRKILQGKRAAFSTNLTFDQLNLLKTNSRKIIPNVVR